MRIETSYIYTRFFPNEKEPKRLRVSILGTREELDRLMKIMETECGKQ